MNKIDKIVNDELDSYKQDILDSITEENQNKEVIIFSSNLGKSIISKKEIAQALQNKTSHLNSYKQNYLQLNKKKKKK